MSTSHAAENPDRDEQDDPDGHDDRDFVNIESDVFPTGDIWHREKWMARQGKRPFAADGHRDAPADCSRHGVKASECECDARLKWGHTEFYRVGDTAKEDAHTHPDCDGVTFIQQEDDRYLFIDCDDVRDPETGEVHPACLALLKILGATYMEVSTSGTGIHALYIGGTPDGVTEPVIYLDDESWGCNDDLPQIEIYATTQQCAVTADHVPGTPTDVNPINTDAFRSILNANGDLPVENPRSRTVDSDSEDTADRDRDRTPNPDVTVTTDLDDVYAAIDDLDNERVADATIVDTWTSRSSPRSFLPTWGSSSDGGTANVVGPDGWRDTGHDDGRGGPVQMAAIDAGVIDHTDADPSTPTGEAWIEAVDHLRSLGFDVPEYAETGKHAYVAVARRYEVDDRDPLRDDAALLLACLAARADDAVPGDADPPEGALNPIAHALFDDAFRALTDGLQDTVRQAYGELDVQTAREEVIDR